jgi:hypothetical protein
MAGGGPAVTTGTGTGGTEGGTAGAGVGVLGGWVPAAGATGAGGGAGCVALEGADPIATGGFRAAGATVCRFGLGACGAVGRELLKELDPELGSELATEGAAVLCSSGGATGGIILMAGAPAS